MGTFYNMQVDGVFDQQAWEAGHDFLTMRGAQVTRDALVAADAQLLLSKTRLGPACKDANCSSVYVLDVLPRDGGDMPLLSIYHLDVRALHPADTAVPYRDCSTNSQSHSALTPSHVARPSA